MNVEDARSSPGHDGDAATLVPPESHTENNDPHEERDSRLEIDIASAPEHEFPDLDDHVCFSINARLRQRAEECTPLEPMLQNWCRNDSSVMEDLIFPEHCTEKCCFMCIVICELKAMCESVVTSKRELAVAKEQLVDKKKELANAKMALIILSGEHSQFDRERKLLSELYDAKVNLVSLTAASVAKGTDSVAKETKFISTQVELISTKVNLILSRHSEVKSILEALSLASNKTSVVTKDGEVTQSNIGLDEGRFDAEPHPSPSNLRHSSEPLPMELGDLELPSLTNAHRELLNPFFQDLQKMFRSAWVLHVNDRKYREKIQVTVNGIMGWSLENSVESQSKVRFYIPGCIGQEKKGVQPIMHAIMVTIIRLLGLGSRITQEQRLPRIGGQARRFVDSVVNNPAQEHLLAILPAMLGIPIEMKPITRKHTAGAELLLKAQNQVVGHLAKRAMFSLDFGGIGENSKVFGLALNMISVTAIVVELSGVGTVDVKVTTRRTKQMPLFDKDTRLKLVRKNAKDVEEAFEEDTEEESMSKGFCFLAQILVSEHNGVGTSLWTNNNGCRHSFSIDSNTATSIKLGSPLGSGAFSHAFKVIKNDSSTEHDRNMFVKVPKSYLMVRSLKNEATALKDLSGNIHIPKLFDTNDPLKPLLIQIRYERSRITCLPLKGIVGVPANRQTSWTVAGLKSMVLQVNDALVYANRQGWAHLDVRPSNIITHPYSNADGNADGFHVMLIDWGCASKTDAKLKRFVGCPPYAHDKLFGVTNDWCPCLDHDLASLAYTVACLHHEHIPWSGDFASHSAVSNSVKNKRSMITSNVLKLLFHDGRDSLDVKSALLKAISNPSRTPRRSLRQLVKSIAI